MQFNKDFFLVGLEQDAAHLYVGNQNSLQRFDSIIFPDEFPSEDSLDASHRQKKSKNINFMLDETSDWLSDWFDQTSPSSNSRLFLAGEKPLVEELIRRTRFKNVVATPVSISFDEHNLSEICHTIRTCLRKEAKDTLEQAFIEFNMAEEENRGKRNIFEIAKAAIRGRVKKLIIADGINVFGKIDKKTGDLAIHPFDLDHEDDDILDDLAQTVLASGGEVVIAPREEIPKERPALAILEGVGKDFKSDRRNSNEKIHFH
jgi:hypothetical protein